MKTRSLSERLLIKAFVIGFFFIVIQLIPNHDLRMLGYGIALAIGLFVL